LSNLTGFHLTEGQAHDLDGANVLLPLVQTDSVLGDQGYDADARVLEPLGAAGKQAVIPPKKNRKEQRWYDKALYKARYAIENSFLNS